MTSIRPNGGQLVVETLLNYGVSALFSVSGDSILPIYDACLDVGLPIYHTRDEAAAVVMADAYARVTGEPAITVVTLGAGAANCTGPLLNAYLDGSPVILIAGGSATKYWGRGGFSEMDATAYLRPLTKWAGTIPAVERIPGFLNAAFRYACSGRPGPVCVQIPADILAASRKGECVRTPYRQPFARQGQATREGVQRALRLLREARRPILVVGSGVWWSQASKAVCQFLEMFQVPAFACYMGRGTISHQFDHYFGLAAPTVNPVARYAADSCDLIVLVGADFDFELEFGSAGIYNPAARVIQVNTESVLIGRNRSATVGLVGDVKHIVRQLIEESGSVGCAWPSWNTELAGISIEAQEAAAGIRDSNRKPIHPARLCYELRQFLDSDAIVSLAGGNIYSWGRTILDPEPPGRLLAPHHTWALGCAIPLALGAKVAQPQRQVLALSGDGSLGYDLMEIETALRYEVPVVCVVANDSEWSMISSAQKRIFGRDRVHASELPQTPYHEMVRVLGGYGERVTEPDGIGPALRRAFDSGVAACVDVLTAAEDSPDILAWYG